MSELATAYTVYAVFPDHETAERVGAAMIDLRLAACVNILSPCTSIYHWEGKVERAGEVPALFKTAAAQVETLISAIAEMHPYDVPAITAWPITDAYPPYLGWLTKETEKTKHF